MPANEKNNRGPLRQAQDRHAPLLHGSRMALCANSQYAEYMEGSCVQWLGCAPVRGAKRDDQAQWYDARRLQRTVHDQA